MNDFTKEELQSIQNCINDSYRGCCPNPNASKDLRNKLQSMIDNYPDAYHLPRDAKVGDTIKIPASDKGWIVYE